SGAGGGGLRSPSSFAEFQHPLLNDLAYFSMPLQDRAQGNMRPQGATTAIRNLQLPARTLLNVSFEIHQADGFYQIESGAVHRPGVHSQRAANAAGNAFQKLKSAHPIPFRFNRDQLQSGSCSALEPISRNFYPAEPRLRQRDHHPAKTAVSNQDARTSTQNQ